MTMRSRTDHAADRIAVLLGRVAPPTRPLVEPHPPRERRPRRSVAIAGVCAIAVTATATALARPHEVSGPQLVARPAPLGTASPTDVVVVDVEGDVVRPGLVTLPLGSRVSDAIAAAGGLARSVPAGQLNLAARLDDGQLLIVGAQAAAAADKRVSLNQGVAADFDALPGVGPVLAARIVAWREAHRRFTSIDQLQEVPGIGAKVFADLKGLVRL